jgi:hypothetical protein
MADTITSAGTVTPAPFVAADPVIVPAPFVPAPVPFVAPVAITPAGVVPSALDPRWHVSWVELQAEIEASFTSMKNLIQRVHDMIHDMGRAKP